jgi:DNA polymerase III epsilon subunit family exonuclease
VSGAAPPPVPTASAPSGAPDKIPSPSQRDAIEAEPRALLVLAGPGAGKTYCLTERIRFLIEHHHVDPARICAFTFTNKAAGEIAHRLDARLGPTAEGITRGTIHWFCAGLLRTHGQQVGVDTGFGIADEDYQVDVLRRINGQRPWYKNLLNQFGAHRLRNETLPRNDLELLGRYEQFLAHRNVLDFDTLLVKTAELLECSPQAAKIRSQWSAILVDEFQDLNPVQYRIVKALARDHHHVFVVGDHEQSIFSWAGADPGVLKHFLNDFGLTSTIHIAENRRCPQTVFALARKLVTINTPLFAGAAAPRADRTSNFSVHAIGFPTEFEEAAWIVADLQGDYASRDHAWGDVALLYRKHMIGDSMEAALLTAGIPCRLAPRRALADDPVVAYVLAAAHVLATPADPLRRDAFFRVSLRRALYNSAVAEAEEQHLSLPTYLDRHSARLPKADATRPQIRRALANWRNLAAIGKQYPTLTALVQELLSKKVGPANPILERHEDEITDPASIQEVVSLASRLRTARSRRTEVWIPPMRGVDIALKGMLREVGILAVRGANPPAEGALWLGSDDVPSMGLALGVFKALQLIEMSDAPHPLTSFTAIDLETTTRDILRAEIVEIGAVRVRDGRIVKSFTSFVKPNGPISTQASAKHGITEDMVADAPRVAEVWPEFRAFCGDDVVVAHNGYEFDFPILRRVARELGDAFGLCTYDTLPLSRELFRTSCTLENLALRFRIPSGRSHRALDDTTALAALLLALGEAKAARARRTALADLLGHLGVALSVAADSDVSEEARQFLKYAQPFVLGRYSSCLDFYERERAESGDDSIPSVADIIDRNGGVKVMLRIRAEKTADQRYPVAMARLRRLISAIPGDTLAEQLPIFLERAVLSKWDGNEPDRGRVNLLTLHATKGLEFSRVYIVGVEDEQLLRSRPGKLPTIEETEEARRLLYVGMTRTVDRLVLTCTAQRGGKPSGGHQFLDEMGLTPGVPL